MDAACRRCVHFTDDPATLERALPGLASFGSAYGSVRAGDGLCRLHDRYLGGNNRCSDFTPPASPGKEGRDHI